MTVAQNDHHPSCEACRPPEGAIGVLYHRNHAGQLLCPCCATPQPQGSAIAYCDDCNTDTCGHHIDAEELWDDLKTALANAFEDGTYRDGPK